MRRVFQKWLLLFVSVAFAVTLTLSILVQTRQARQNAEGLLALRLEDAKELIGENTLDVERISELTSEGALAKARAFAALLAADPSLAQSEGRLTTLLSTLDVDQLHVIDGQGRIVASTNPVYIGYDMDSQAQSAEFMALLSDATLEIVQQPQKIGYDGDTVMQYAGVARLDAAGFVQVGYVPARLQEALEVADIKNLAPEFRIGNGGGIMVCKNGIVVSATDSDYLGISLSHFGVDPKVLLSTGAFTLETDKGVHCLAMASTYADFAVLGMLPLNEVYLSRQTMIGILTVCNLILFAVVFFLVSFLVKRVVIDGIYSVNGSLAKITSGDLGEMVAVRTNPEFSALSDGINSMVEALKRLIAEAEARIAAELEFAHNIQVSCLPSIFPPYPDRTEFSLYATMQPAKEVGGDFYDFFLIGDNRLCVVIADVSGKGIPGAMFMMRAKTCIKDSVLAGAHRRRDLATIMDEVNDRLCENNEAGMFVTAFVGVLNYTRNTLTYVNAGHNLPLLRQNGRFDWLKIGKRSFVMAAMEGYRYKAETVALHKGDALFLYTDGVTEAQDKTQALYGDARLLALMNAMPPDADPVEEIRRTYADVCAFAQGAPQFDDITMLALQIREEGRTCE